ncbi:DUF6577 family protein [Algoriphagus hitonicola]|uniref:Transcriptional regulator, AbiEi antitoxin, Type IV TA system n=1 Tax=Algoriphagus hitonicola TaxID=435880 RepID=A0A1I2XD87_9BACT|nr:DUF6577 family protein [Algoriphagus hitonicola]SFH11468.1 hypothetical protein SAMN04487988_11810 [Algoriphagus hitonicola]
MDFFCSKDQEVKATTVNWRIYKLVQEGIITRVSRGEFKLGFGKSYSPGLSNQQISLYRKLKTEFPFLSICIWNTSVINEFMLHQPGRFYNLVEVEKEGMESLFYFLKDKNIPVYLDPTPELIRRYVNDVKDPWIVKLLVTESPTQEINGITTVTLEKILVDIFCEAFLFDAQQGSEMDQIFKEAFEKYAISESKMLRYASRRRKKQELEIYLKEISIYRQQF